MMEFRKICNHPYLFLDEYYNDTLLWRVSAKFELLEKLIPKMIIKKHRILMFFQMT